MRLYVSASQFFGSSQKGNPIGAISAGWKMLGARMESSLMKRSHESLMNRIVGISIAQE